MSIYVVKYIVNYTIFSSDSFHLKLSTELFMFLTIKMDIEGKACSNRQTDITHTHTLGFLLVLSLIVTLHCLDLLQPIIIWV